MFFIQNGIEVEVIAAGNFTSGKKLYDTSMIPLKYCPLRGSCLRIGIRMEEQNYTEILSYWGYFRDDDFILLLLYHEYWEMCQVIGSNMYK